MPKPQTNIDSNVLEKRTIGVIKEIGFGSKEFKKYLFDRIGFESITAYNTFLIKKNT